MSQEQTPFFLRAQDLLQTLCEVSFKNTTSNTGTLQSTSPELDDIQEDGFSIKLPIHSCALGHLLLIQIVRKVSSAMKADVIPKFHEIVITAKVTGLETLDASSELVTVSLYQHQSDRWRLFLQDLSARQSEVDEIVKRFRE